MYIALPDAVAGAMAGYLALWSVYWLFRLLTGKEALGYGDFKLLAALGAWCGWQVLPQVLLLASASGLVWTLLQRLWTRQSLQQPLAFGPGWRWPAGVFFSGSRWSSVCEPTGRAGCRPAAAATSIFCCGGSGRRWQDRPARRASDSVPSSLSAPRGSSLARRRSDRG